LLLRNALAISIQLSALNALIAHAKESVSHEPPRARSQ
jgi:hypothetical protein